MVDTSKYDFIVNEDDELMLLLYVREFEPDNATIKIDFANGNATLFRGPESTVEIQNIPQEVIDPLSEIDSLLVCELSVEEDESKTEIIYAYEAEIID